MPTVALGTAASVAVLLVWVETVPEAQVPPSEVRRDARAGARRGQARVALRQAQEGKDQSVVVVVVVAARERPAKVAARERLRLAAQAQPAETAAVGVTEA